MSSKETLATLRALEELQGTLREVRENLGAVCSHLGILSPADGESTGSIMTPIETSDANITKPTTMYYSVQLLLRLVIWRAES